MIRKRSLWKIIFSKILFIILFFILIFLIAGIAKITSKRYKINKEIDKLKDEINNLDKQNNDLTQLIEYLDTLSFKEKEARLKLGLQKEGEKTVIISSPYSELKVEEEKEEKKDLTPANIFKWWDYFFSKK